MCGPVECVVEHFDDVRCKCLVIADYFQTNIIGREFVNIGFDEATHQPHQIANFIFGTLPVFAAEAVEAELFDSDASAVLDDRPDAGDASAMAFGMFALMFVFTLVQLRVMRGEVEY